MRRLSGRDVRFLAVGAVGGTYVSSACESALNGQWASAVAVLVVAAALAAVTWAIFVWAWES